jgi:hypothetical protein
MSGVWECSACGGVANEVRRPERCSECGTAGSFFPAESDDTHALDAEDNVLRIIWRQAMREGRGRNSPTPRSRESRRTLP